MNIPEDIRNQHIYMPGKTRYGKSNLMFWMVLNDIKKGLGVGVLDPKNDLVELLLKHIPANRAKDTIYLSSRNPIPIDFMSWETQDEKDQLADDIQLTIEQLSVNTAGDRWPSVLQWTIKAVLEAKEYSFLDIYYFLASQKKRDEILERVQNEDSQNYWKEQYPHLPKDSANAITTRMSKFLTPEFKIILGSNKGLNIFNLMEDEMVFLVNLAKSGRRSGNLLGRLLVSKFQQAAMKRVDQHEKDRKPFYLYADEFQRFQTSAFDDILAEAGGLQLCLTLAHQYPEQLDDKILNAICGCISTFFFFRMRPKAAALFKDEIPSMESKPVWKRSPKSGEMEWIREPVPFDMAKLASFPRGRVLYRAADGTARIFTTPKPPEPIRAHYAKAIMKRTMEVYGLPDSKEKLPSSRDGNPSPSAAKPEENESPTIQFDKPKPRHP